MQTIEYKNPTIDKSEWGNGPWVDEPDKKQWRDEETGLPCLIVRNVHVSGALCGYVGVPKGHPYYGWDYDALCGVDVHGGLTFANKCQEEQNDFEGICHKNDTDDDIWWLGFDCAHCYDLVPRMNKYSIPFSEETYKDFSFVTHEVEKLAKILKAAELFKRKEDKD